ncbi:MAG: PilZ domain-containing protein [Nitrospira sp.]|nr:PilZ domain-containing protein [Nitrospira sp.]
MTVDLALVCWAKGRCFGWEFASVGVAGMNRLAGFSRPPARLHCKAVAAVIPAAWSGEGEDFVEEAKTSRKSRRIAIGCRLVFFGEDEVEGEGEVLDLSFTGCMAKSDSTMQPGLQMKVSLFLSDGHEWPVRVDEAIVRWARGGEFGVEFLALRPPQLQRIQQFLIKTKPL